jgi:hypothetical protein
MHPFQHHHLLGITAMLSVFSYHDWGRVIADYADNGCAATVISDESEYAPCMHPAKSLFTPHSVYHPANQGKRIWIYNYYIYSSTKENQCRERPAHCYCQCFVFPWFCSCSPAARLNLHWMFPCASLTLASAARNRRSLRCCIPRRALDYLTGHSFLGSITRKGNCHASH